MLKQKLYQTASRFFVFLCVCNQAQSWQLADNLLMTKWTKDVPQIKRQEWINLNGLWNYVIYH